MAYSRAMLKLKGVLGHNELEKHHRETDLYELKVSLRHRN